jgi:hypothetical protein
MYVSFASSYFISLYQPLLDTHSESKLAVKSVLSLAFVHHTALIAAADAVIGNKAIIPISIDSTNITLRILDLVFIEFFSFSCLHGNCRIGVACA